MIISKVPMRISFFGGATDYKPFYEQSGSVLIGTTINKYVYNSVRYIPRIIGDDYIITYSQIEKVKNIDDIRNSLFRETLRYYKIYKPIELHFFSEIPSRTGLGGSSACCVSLANALCCLEGIPKDKHQICHDAIKIEREILKEPGGIQDHIWASYGGFNIISINKNGSFDIKKMPISDSFKKEFESSLLLIYTNSQRFNNEAAKSHIEKDKKNILVIAKQAVDAFSKEDIKEIGKLLYASWKEKRALSKEISNYHIDSVIHDSISSGAFGAKLVGGGSGGFVLVICDKNVRKKIKSKYNEFIIDFQMETDGPVNIKI